MTTILTNEQLMLIVVVISCAFTIQFMSPRPKVFFVKR